MRTVERMAELMDGVLAALKAENWAVEMVDSKVVTMVVSTAVLLVAKLEKLLEVLLV